VKPNGAILFLAVGMPSVKLVAKGNVRCVGIQYLDRWRSRAALDAFLRMAASGDVCDEYGSVTLQRAPNVHDAKGIFRIVRECQSTCSLPARF